MVPGVTRANWTDYLLAVAQSQLKVCVFSGGACRIYSGNLRYVLRRTLGNCNIFATKSLASSLSNYLP